MLYIQLIKSHKDDTKNYFICTQGTRHYSLLYTSAFYVLVLQAADQNWSKYYEYTYNDVRIETFIIDYNMLHLIADYENFNRESIELTETMF